MQTAPFEEIVKLRPRGVFTVPKKLRKGLFEENDIVKIKRVGRKLLIEPVRTIFYPVRSYNEEELKEFFELDEKETKEFKTKGII